MVALHAVGPRLKSGQPALTPKAARHALCMIRNYGARRRRVFNGSGTKIFVGVRVDLHNASGFRGTVGGLTVLGTTVNYVRRPCQC